MTKPLFSRSWPYIFSSFVPSSSAAATITYVQRLKREQAHADGKILFVCPTCDSIFIPKGKRCPACKRTDIRTVRALVFSTLSTFKKELHAELAGKGWEKERIEKRWAEITRECNR